MNRYWYTDGDYEYQGEDDARPLNVVNCEVNSLELDYAGSELLAVL